MKTRLCEFCQHDMQRHIVDGCTTSECWCRRPHDKSIKKIRNEPLDHYIYKFYLKWFFDKVLGAHYSEVEHVFSTYHKGQNVIFPVDVYAESKTGNKTAVNIDGGIHQHSKIQIGKTKNRDMTLREYCLNHNIHYYVIPKEAFAIKLGLEFLFEGYRIA